MSKDDHPTCKYFLGFLSDYVDGELSEDLCREIENHTAECQNCRVVVETLHKTISLYHQSAEETTEISNEARAKLFTSLKLDDYIKR
jgi:anti-sigma factor RsiW